MSTPAEKWIIPFVHSPVLFPSPHWSCTLDIPSAELLISKGDGGFSFSKSIQPSFVGLKDLLQRLYDKMPVLQTLDCDYTMRYGRNNQGDLNVFDLLVSLLVIGNKMGKYEHTPESLCDLFFSIYDETPSIYANRLHALVFGGAFFQGDTSAIDCSRLFIPGSIMAYFLQSKKPIGLFQSEGDQHGNDQHPFLILQYIKALELGDFELASNLFTQHFLNMNHFNDIVGEDFGDMLKGVQSISFALDEKGNSALLLLPSSVPGDLIVNTLSETSNLKVFPINISREGVNKA